MSHSPLINRVVSICVFAALISVGGTHMFAQSSRSADLGLGLGLDFPYQAIVRNNETEIFSGPAAVHYATDKISQGEIVQVYRHDPGGWCAIRPNEGSFSLIPEAAVEIIDDGIGRIKQDNTQAWVGTRLGSVEKPLWQIKLSQGEEVEILGEASWPSPDGHSTIWYQIAPPAGEFRWVRFADLQTPPTDTHSMAAADSFDASMGQTDSGFKYDKLPETKSNRVQPKTSNFQFATDQTEDASAAQSAEHEKWTEKQQPLVAARGHRVVGQPKPQRQRLPNHPTQNDLDFKFRPIGQTASVSGTFQSTADEEVIRDSKVSPAAYQSPILDRNDHDTNPSQSFGRSTSEDSRWQRGRAEIVQQKNRYEAKYDQFNARQQAQRQSSLNQSSFDQRDIEDSFGLRWDDLPSHRRTPHDRHYTSGGGRYDTLIENSYPPADRYASLNSEFEVMPYSTLAEKLTARLAKVEEELTNEMLKRPNEWQLADLELNVGQIYSQTSNPVERLQAQRILDKISKCKVIRNGYTKNFQATGETFGTSVRALSDTRDVQFSLGPGYTTQSDPASVLGGLDNESLTSWDTTARGQIVGSGVDTDFEMNARFDASGWLTELVSEDRNNRPVYVLVNDGGQITHHIAPAPGLNLHRYLKSKVGVTGRRGYNNRMKLDHITAEAIDELQQF